jgi:crotonobetainyl-CoA:carnitine CoA-transferase CaiB-like acyl-CoA transferase
MARDFSCLNSVNLLRGMNAPLKGLKVLDLSRVLAGPWASQLLGDYGADVVKVERPGCGDDTRAWGPPWLGTESAYFLSTNRNKRSIAIDLSLRDGRRVVRELAATADVVIENFRVGTLERFGLAPADLMRDNAGLIVCSISAFGQTGSRAAEPGYDAMIQASGGLMSITGAPDGEGGGPQKVGVAIADIMAGMYAVSAILAALHARDLTGKGQHIDVPLYDSQVAWLANQNLNYLVGGEVPVRMGTAHPNLVPYQAFATADGNLMLAVGNDAQFRHCTAIVGRPELADDNRYATNEARIANRAELVRLIGAALREKPTQTWLEAFGAGGVPAGPINDIGKVLGGAYAQERGFVCEIENGAGERVPQVANPVRFQTTPVAYDRAPPLLGEHTEEVLREWLGYSAARIETLRKESAIQSR